MSANYFEFQNKLYKIIKTDCVYNPDKKDASSYLVTTNLETHKVNHYELVILNNDSDTIQLNDSAEICNNVSFDIEDLKKAIKSKNDASISDEKLSQDAKNLSLIEIVSDQNPSKPLVSLIEIIEGITNSKNILSLIEISQNEYYKLSLIEIKKQDSLDENEDEIANEREDMLEERLDKDEKERKIAILKTKEKEKEESNKTIQDKKKIDTLLKKLQTLKTDQSEDGNIKQIEQYIQVLNELNLEYVPDHNYYDNDDDDDYYQEVIKEIETFINSLKKDA